MVILVSWSSRSKKKKRLAELLLKDFGMRKISPNTAIGSLNKKDALEFRKKMSDTFTLKTDTFLAIKLCSKCEKALLKNYPKIEHLNIDKFEKQLEVY
ncbi:MAG: hypothetical protein ACE5FW_02750 [Candidatus Aenigmatarchaeota archaeon]